MANVKDIMGVNKSDGSFRTGDTPPTPEDMKMTIKHTSDSVKYNWPHAYEHLEELLEKLDRLSDYKPEEAAKLAKFVYKKIEPLLRKIKSYG